MFQEDHKLFIKKAKEEYKKIGYIECPAFGGEKVYFNRYGLRHLFYKDRVSRPIEEVIKRINLLQYASNILKHIKNVDNEERRTKNKTYAYFWTIKYSINSDLRIRIILRRLDNGNLHFFSIMSE